MEKLSLDKFQDSEILTNSLVKTGGCDSFATHYYKHTGGRGSDRHWPGTGMSRLDNGLVFY